MGEISLFVLKTWQFFNVIDFERKRNSDDHIYSHDSFSEVSIFLRYFQKSSKPADSNSVDILTFCQTWVYDKELWFVFTIQRIVKQFPTEKISHNVHNCCMHLLACTSISASFSPRHSEFFYLVEKEIESTKSLR